MSSTEGSSSVRMRSIYVSTPVEASSSTDNGKGGGDDWDWLNSNRNIAHTTSNGIADVDDDIKDEKVGSAELTLELPESTHSLLFTEKTCSLPHYFAVAILLISFTCLWLAFEDNLLANSTKENKWNIPANVTTSVRVAQYLSIFVALLMEEEIPTGLYLLRQIRKKEFIKRLDNMNYKKFVFASILRIFSGYFFLINVFVILVQAEGVIDIFYDVLALQFVQQLDDIAFGLSKMEVLGQRMKSACTAPAFSVEFEKAKHHCRKQDALLKSIYFLNFGCFLAGLIVVSIRQSNGALFCDSITTEFQNEVWTGALALNLETGEWEDFTLVFSYFSGVYKQDGYLAGRPVYREMRKFDRQSFDEDWVVPAEISYCEEISAWVFRHDNIRKGNDESGCNWLLRSPETSEFDLLKVDSGWHIWVGTVETTTVLTSCNECSDDIDCNLNGKCVDGKCDCNKEDGVRFMGMHCETKLPKECETIIGEGRNETFSTEYLDFIPGEDAVLFQEYSRPVYVYRGEVLEDMSEGDIIWMVYTGSRWFGMQFNLGDRNATQRDLVLGTRNFHAFWNKAYDDVTAYVSDPTKSSTPGKSALVLFCLGVDWYVIGERGSQFGPFGALYPVQVHNQTGRGFFRCAGEDYKLSQNKTNTSRKLKHQWPNKKKAAFLKSRN